jgi:hypothetical protein
MRLLADVLYRGRCDAGMQTEVLLHVSNMTIWAICFTAARDKPATKAILGHLLAIKQPQEDDFILSFEDRQDVVFAEVRMMKGNVSGNVLGVCRVAGHKAEAVGGGRG